ncbi:hydantoinase/oxoprolinase family protein [Haloplanus aerogenes]|uniref:Hydantoinase/oxoprolinase family protein n=1 Tax=Haloplanus aerogenes TaxID=660522 RepID=A0A3M0CXQ6_9EURY|nr:hydantoinase/oxoprolinase family protein [Haloplanus aerogenes]AZH25226.1 hydantoinase/oxoprolinase family protein [Haloplanus aerogenes]RMB13545.1 N-methylhydantoinase A [Haloplanus aerogenes]
METDARVGVDVGGTFTDVVVADESGLTMLKVPSTPDSPDRGVLDGLDAASEQGDVDPEAVAFFGHGTTVATNALLEREWAETALVTTEGFRDAVEIGRQTRPSLYDLRAEKPSPIVDRDRRYEVVERLDRRGEVVEPLDEEEARSIARTVADADVESVAVAFLFAFENDAHERRVRDLLHKEGVDGEISLSSEVLPEIREYERTLATTINAALKPVMNRYLGRLEEGVAEAGVPAALKVMQSNGGVASAQVTRERPVNTLLSGPAAGVRGAAHVAGETGFDDVLTMDMGGTSCDVSLVRDGDPVVTTEGQVGDYPVNVPMVDVHTIGAGGGSIAWVDEGGSLRVGPRSAGADPGPICYGRGGTDPTVTDAHLLLGRIDPASFFEGSADESTVREAVRESVADPLGLSVEEAAQGILDVANANMERALRVVSVERGHDPRDFSLVAYGGAGPLHAAELAAELDVPRVVVPRSAGVLSALGLLISDAVYEEGVSAVRPWTEVDPADLTERFEGMEAEGRERLETEGYPADRRRFERAVDLRYRGQSFDLRVPVPEGRLDADTLDTVADRFHQRHERRYGHASPDEPVELVTVRLRSRGVVDPPALSMAEGGTTDPTPRTTRPATFGGETGETPIYDRSALGPGAELDGPAVIEGVESTAVVPPEADAHVDDLGNVVIEP